MTKLLLTVSLLLTALACDGSGDPTLEADASPDSLTQVRADGGVDLLPATKPDTLPVVKTDTLPEVKTDAQGTRATSCPTPYGIAPKKGYVFTKGTVGCDDPYFTTHVPNRTCTEILSGSPIPEMGDAPCCVPTTRGLEIVNPSDLLEVSMMKGSGSVWTRTDHGGPACYPQATPFIGQYAICSMDGKFLGWTCG
jgi:hypothetical protein